MKRVVLIASAVLIVLVGAVLLRRPTPVEQNDARRTSAADLPAPVPVTEAQNVVAVPPSAVLSNDSALLGETILEGYASTNLSPENDLVLVSRLMENSLLLLKSAANRPLSANEDWADLLRGKNGAQERFIPDGHIALNAKGQLVDRWRTPLFFHALGAGRYEIRSAGPDGELWTADDLHRNADGSSRRGTNQDSISLYEAATNRQQGMRSR